MFIRYVSWIVTVTLVLFCVYICSAQVNAQQQQQQQQDNKVEVSRVCLGCICEIATGCNRTIGCRGSICGPFSITWDYWADANKPTLNNQPSNSNDAYSECVNNLECATRTMQNYMNRFGRDCTGNGVVDCEDYLRIHMLGAYGCTGHLNSKHENKYHLCMRRFG